MVKHKVESRSLQVKSLNSYRFLMNTLTGFICDMHHLWQMHAHTLAEFLLSRLRRRLRNKPETGRR